MRRLLNFLYYFLAIISCDIVQATSWKWYRKAFEGHWEQWWIDFPICSTMWLDVKGCHKDYGRPPLARGTPICEEHHAEVG